MKISIRRFATGIFVAASAMIGLGAVQAPVVGASSSAAIVASYVTPGAFCAASLRGTKDKSVNGVVLTCTTSKTDSRLRWRQVVK
jgi:hypothetical protein